MGPIYLSVISKTIANISAESTYDKESQNIKLFLEKNFFLHFSGHLKVPGPSGITSFPLLYPAVIWPRDNSDLSGVSYQRMKCISGLDFKTLGNSPEKPKTELSQDLFSRLEDIDYPL